MTLITYKWSIAEWHELVNSGILQDKPVELLEGEIIEMSPEGIEHSYTNQSIADYLRELFQGQAYIRDAHPITLDNSEPEPDIAIVRLPKDIYWLIEISKKTLKKDLEQKIVTYARNGIPEYWVIDLVNQKLFVHTQLQDSKYLKVVEYKTGIVTSLAFPNIQIDLAQILLF